MIGEIRNIRNNKGIPQKEKISLFINDSDNSYNDINDPLVIKLANLGELEYTDKKIENAVSFVVKSTEFYVLLNEPVDKEAEIKELEKDLAYTKGFLETVMKKLSNERFVSNAQPQVLEKEKNKQSDAEGKIKAIEERLTMLKK